MRPEGLAGRLFGVLMEVINAPAYGFALDLLELGPADDVLEIGFGTGAMIQLILAHTGGVVAGVDPAATMVKVASHRHRVRAAGPRVRLALGTDAGVAAAGSAFDRVVALHSFQFWENPQATMARLNVLLRPGGRLVLVLRRCARGDADGLPNPLSRGADEAGAALELLRESGFEARRESRGRMLALVGRKP
jgi:SAM-dependent methyltransferase